MRTLAAVLDAQGQRFRIADLEMDEPRSGEVRVRVLASGICHSDHHFRSGFRPIRTPVVLGHEGVGVVEETGPGVGGLRAGDEVIFSMVPSCGACRFCRAGDRSLCLRGVVSPDASLLDGTYRLHDGDRTVGQASRLGTFAERLVCPEDSCVPVELGGDPAAAALLGCGVITGVGAVLNAGHLVPGESVAILGAGGVGLNAVMGARIGGATTIIAIDLSAERLRLAKELGATHAITAGEAAVAGVRALTGGFGTDLAVLVTGIVGEAAFRSAYAMARPGGRLVVVGASEPALRTLPVDPALFLRDQKSVVGTIGGSRDLTAEIQRCHGLWRSGQLPLDRLVTRRGVLRAIEEGFQDLEAGRGVRTVIEHG